MKFDTKIDTTGFKSGTNTIKSQANSMKSTLLSLGKTIGVVFGLTALVAFGKQAIDTASDLQEVQNVVDTAFGDMAYKMEDFADTSIESFGISKLAAKQTGSTFIAMARGMGIAIDNSSDMAVSLTGLSADMASFYNVRQDVASTALKSIFTGETETLKQFGIVMTQANLQAFAYSKGIKQNVADMDQASITQLRYMYVMQQTNLAQGDFAKTSGSWANQTRVLKEQWKEFLGILGSGLVQVLTPAIQMLNSTMSNLISFANTASKVLSSVFGFEQSTTKIASSTKAVADNTAGASSGISSVGKAAKKAAKDTQKSTASIDQLNTITKNVADNSSDAASKLGGLGSVSPVGVDTSKTGPDTSGIEKNLSGLADKILSALQPAIDALGRLKEAVKPFANTIGQGLKWFLDNVLAPLGKWVISDSIPKFIDLLAASIDFLNSIIIALEPLAVWLFDNFLKPIAIWTGGAIILILGGMATALTKVSDWINKNQSVVQVGTAVVLAFVGAWELTKVLAFIQMSGGLVAAITSITAALWACTGAKVVDKAETIALTAMYAKDFIVSLVSGTVALVKQAAQWVINTGLKIADTAATVAMTAATVAWNVVCAIATAATTALGVAVAFLTSPIGLVILAIGALIAIGILLYKNWDSIQAYASTAWNVIKAIFISFSQWLGSVFSTDFSKKFEFLGEILNAYVANVKNIFDAIKRIFSGVITFISGVFSDDWKKAWEGIKDIFGGIFDGLVALVKAPINLIIVIINAMIDGIVSGVNLVINAINGINIKVPNWIPGIGGKGIGFNLPVLTAPKIPKLATGTVVPANYGNFLSILGDNKQAPEVVSPVPTMKQAFKEALAEMGTSKGGQTVIKVYLEGKQIWEEVVNQNNYNTRRTGENALA